MGLTKGTYITHTVDKIDYEITTVDSSAAAVTVEGGIASFTLNEVISVESATTGNMVLVTNNEDRYVYNDQRGTTENKECSGRGLCDGSSGTCECFKGYTDDDCSSKFIGIAIMHIHMYLHSLRVVFSCIFSSTGTAIVWCFNLYGRRRSCLLSIEMVMRKPCP